MVLGWNTIKTSVLVGKTACSVLFDRSGFQFQFFPPYLPISFIMYQITLYSFNKFLWDAQLVKITSFSWHIMYSTCGRKSCLLFKSRSCELLLFCVWGVEQCHPMCCDRDEERAASALFPCRSACMVTTWFGVFVSLIQTCQGCPCSYPYLWSSSFGRLRSGQFRLQLKADVQK